jgi:L-ascorbate metabolism protein UlaG (beta-lactamase superfamily)
LLLAATLLVAFQTGCAPAVFLKYREDPVLYKEPPRNAITFWGHACSYIDIEGFGIVTDPVFETRYSVFHKRKIPSPPAQTFDQTSVVLISHAHLDHLHPETLARFASHTVVLCPAPSAKKARESGRWVMVMKPGDEFSFPGGTITAVLAHHPGGRSSRKARADGGALGYVISTSRLTIYYSGDTDYFPGIAQIGERYRPDIAILNLNVHLKPQDALRAAEDLGMPVVIPTHTAAYDGPHAGRDFRYRGEFVKLMGPLAVPLRVGESLPLPGYRGAKAPVRARGAPTPFAARKTG